MEYYIKQKGRIKGPFSEKEMQEMLASLKIGKKTLCRTSNQQRFAQLWKVIPQTVAAIEEQRVSSDSLEQEPDVSDMIVTTETAFLDISIDKRLGIITSEVAFGMNIFRDLFAGLRDSVGGRSGSVQKVLADSKRTVLSEMKYEAFRRGADAIVGVSFNYNELSGQGKSMLLLVGVGTAVSIKKSEA